MVRFQKQEKSDHKLRRSRQEKELAQLQEIVIDGSMKKESFLEEN